MKVAVIGSRDMTIENLGNYLPAETKEIVSGGARGIDTCAGEYALRNNIKLTEFLPEYNKYGRIAPLLRNNQIIEYADKVIAFWNGKSRGTLYVIEKCREMNTPCTVYLKKNSRFFEYTI